MAAVDDESHSSDQAKQGRQEGKAKGEGKVR
jgi:hypothetical protein